MKLTKYKQIYEPTCPRFRSLNFIDVSLYQKKKTLPYHVLSNASQFHVSTPICHTKRSMKADNANASPDRHVCTRLVSLMIQQSAIRAILCPLNLVRDSAQYNTQGSRIPDQWNTGWWFKKGLDSCERNTLVAACYFRG